MKIETKFDIGQEVYYIVKIINNKNKFMKKVVCNKIRMIVINQTEQVYWVDGYPYKESELFATPKEAEARLKDLLKGDK